MTLLELYDLVYARIDVEHQIAFVLPAPDGRVIGSALNRKRRDFSERDREMLQTVRPFVVPAYDHAAERVRLLANVAALERTADDSAQAVILRRPTAGSSRRLPAAARWLTELAAPEGRDRLPGSLAEWAHPQRLRARRAGDGARVLEPLRLQTPDGVLTARFLPNGVDGFDAVILKSEPRALDPERLRSCGLTRRESEVLELVAAGGSNAQIARRLGRSESTIAKHLEHVYAKLGVSNRTAAVALARRADVSPSM